MILGADEITTRKLSSFPVCGRSSEQWIEPQGHKRKVRNHTKRQGGKQGTTDKRLSGGPGELRLIGTAIEQDLAVEGKKVH